MLLTERQNQLFKAMVEEYVSTAHPIASGALAKAFALDVSPATVRNDMAVLEEQGLITQPHTSAGRIPTAKGYQYYVEEFVANIDLPGAQQRKLEQALAQEMEDTVKRMARMAADLSMEAVFMSGPGQYTFYTGMSNVLKQPEFADRELMLSLSAVMDSLDEMVDSMARQAGPEIEVLIGNDNPWSPELSVIVTEYRTRGGDTGVIGLLGPMRMTYKQNMAVIKTMQSILNTYE